MTFVPAGAVLAYMSLIIDAYLRMNVGYRVASDIKDTTDHLGPWKTLEALGLVTLGWVHWHNQDRRHGFIGDIPPAEF